MRKQVFSIRGKEMSKKELEKVASAALIRLRSGEDPMTVTAWAVEHVK